MAIFLAGQGGERKEIDPGALMQLAAKKKGEGGFLHGKQREIIATPSEFIGGGVGGGAPKVAPRTNLPAVRAGRIPRGKSSIPEVKREIIDVNFNALKPNTRVEVHINPSKNDLLRLIKDSTGKHESGTGFIEGDLRYSIHPDTEALHVWRAFEGTHEESAAAFPGTPGAGPDTGYIANTEKGLIVIDGLGRRIGKSKNPALQRLLKKHETIGETFEAEPEVGKRRVVDVQLPEFGDMKTGRPPSQVDRGTTPVIINPSMGDINKLIKEVSSLSRPDAGFENVQDALRFSVDLKTNELYIWKAFDATHPDIRDRFPDLGIIGDKAGFIWKKDGKLITVSGPGFQERDLNALLKAGRTIGETFKAGPEEPEVGKSRIIDIAFNKDSFDTSSVAVNPSKKDLAKILKGVKGVATPSLSLDGAFIKGDLRYSIHPDTKELYVWPAALGTHQQAAVKIPGLLVEGPTTGIILNTRDGLRIIDDFGELTKNSDNPALQKLLGGGTIGQVFNAPDEPEPPTIDEAFPDKENIVSFSSVDLKDSLPKAVLNKFSAQGLIPNRFDVDLFGGAGGIFKEAGREQAKTMFKFPKQEGFPSVDLTKARTDLADGSVGSVIADFPFLVNKYLGSSSSSTKKLGAIQGSFAVNTKGELKLIQITGAMEAIRILEPGGVALFKTQDVRPASGSGRKIFIPSTQVIMDVAEGQGMKLIGRQSVKSRGKGIKPVEWLVYKKPTGDVLPFKKE